MYRKLDAKYVFVSALYSRTVRLGQRRSFLIDHMVEIVQHKEILRRHMPEALRLAVAKNVENRLFAQAISPIICGPMSITVKIPNIF